MVNGEPLSFKAWPWWNTYAKVDGPSPMHILVALTGLSGILQKYVLHYDMTTRL